MANKCPKTLGNKGLSGISAIDENALQHFCNTQYKKREEEWLQVAFK